MHEKYAAFLCSPLVGPSASGKIARNDVIPTYTVKRSSWHTIVTIRFAHIIWRRTNRQTAITFSLELLTELKLYEQCFNYSVLK